MQRQVLEPPPELAARRPDIDPALASCIMRALAKRPADRWTSAGEMREALGAAHRSTV
jgi:serine/threonine-protein kinase